METADEILTEVMNESPYNANFSLSRPYIVKAMKRYAELKQKQLLSVDGIRLRSILEDRLKSHKETYDNAWKNLTSESKYKKEDGIEPFYRLQRLYKIKADEIQIILDLYEA